MSYTLDNRDIVISGWENGISDNPYTGIYDMRNVDPITIQGEVSVAMKTEAMQTQAPITAVAFTADHTINTFTYDGVVPLEVNTAITFVGTDLPAGLSTDTCYWIKTKTATTFTISAISAGGAEKDITGNGTGVMTFSTIQMGKPLYFTTAISSNYNKIYFLLDSPNGRIWVYDDGSIGSTKKWIYTKNRASENTVFYNYTNFLIYWKGYLFHFSATSIYVKAIGDPGNFKLPSLAWLTSGSWLDWQTTATSANSADSKYAIVDIIDGSLRFCNDRNIGSVLEVDGTTFHPVTGIVSAADGSTTNGDNTITTTSGWFTTAMVGSNITGLNIPVGAYITSFTDHHTVEISEAATGTAGPGTVFTIPTSWTFSTASLSGDLPEGDQANCLAMLGQTLLIGGNLNYIYPWDRISDTYSTPIYLSENFVSRMVTVNTTTYIFAGFKGRIYMTNGSNVSLFKEIPDYLAETTNPYFKWTDAVFNRNQLYFGFQVQTNSGTTINEYGGLWAIDLDTKALRLQNQLSYGTYSGYLSCLCQNTGTFRSQTFSSADGYSLFLGWYSGSLGGVDKGISSPYTGTEAYVISDMIPVGQFLTKRTFENLEYKLSNPLVTGETVTLGYRSDISSAFTNVPITQGGGVGELSGTGNVNFENVQWIQIQAILTSTATNPSYNRFRELRIR